MKGLLKKAEEYKQSIKGGRIVSLDRYDVIAEWDDVKHAYYNGYKEAWEWKSVDDELPDNENELKRHYFVKFSTDENIQGYYLTTAMFIDGNWSLRKEDMKFKDLIFEWLEIKTS